MIEFDVVIAGGAMAGATLALSLAKQQPSLSIAVIEAFPSHTESHPGYDARSIALAHGSVRLLSQWGLWDGMSPHATAIQHIHVSDKGHAGITRVDAKQHNVEALGYVVELASVGQYYASLLDAADNVTQFCPDSIQSLKAEASGYSLILNSGAALSTRLLVAADGGQSHVSNLLGIESSAYDFNQVALIANVTTAVNHQGKAFERFTENGPLAMLPMSEGRSSLVWCMSAAEAARMQQEDDEVFLQALQQAFGWRLGALTKTGQRDCYPLVLRQRNALIAHHAVVIGNAAQSLHPIAGQGFNLGLRDVAALVKAVTEATEISTESIGSVEMLQRYQQRRQVDRQKTVQLTSSLVSLFSTSSFPFVVGRNLGLMAMGQCGALQLPLVKHTMGWRTNL